MNDQKLILSEKDTEILNLRKEGIPVEKIAYKVFLSEIAVYKRLQKMRDQIGAENDLELINFCYNNGYLSKVA